MPVPRLPGDHAYAIDFSYIDRTLSRDFGWSQQDQKYFVKDDSTWLSEVNDWIIPGEVIWHLSGGRGNDTLGASWNEDTLVGNLGSDRLIGMDEDDLLIGDRWNSESEGHADTLDGGNGDDALYGGGGDDSLLGGEGDDTLVGNDGNDILIGGNGADVVAGGKGNDLYHLGSADTIEESAGEGTDTVLVLGQATYTLHANVENATYQFEGNGRLIGNELNNLLIGGNGADTLQGGAGNDTLAGNGGADSMIGGAGDDHYNVFDTTDRVVEGANAGIDTVYTSLTSYTLGANVENLNALGSGITGNGNTLNNKMDGTSGADLFRGLDGNDTVNGFGGNDTVLGGTGNDSLSGLWGIDQLRGEAGNDSLYGGDDMDYLYGGDDNDLADGGAFSDIVYGDAGNDTLIGGTGHDTLYGGTGNDILRGGSDNDRLRGNEGADKLYGDAGADIFIYGSTAESNTAMGRDIIYDFVKGVDRIDLSLIDANTTLAGNQAFSFVGAAPFFASPGDLTVSVGLLGSTVNGDVNGDGITDFSLTVMGVTNLAASDFIL